MYFVVVMAYICMIMRVYLYKMPTKVIQDIQVAAGGPMDCDYRRVSKARGFVSDQASLGRGMIDSVGCDRGVEGIESSLDDSESRR